MRTNDGVCWKNTCVKTLTECTRQPGEARWAQFHNILLQFSLGEKTTAKQITEINKTQVEFEKKVSSDWESQLAAVICPYNALVAYDRADQDFFLKQWRELDRILLPREVGLAPWCWRSFLRCTCVRASLLCEETCADSQPSSSENIFSLKKMFLNNMVS